MSKKLFKAFHGDTNSLLVVGYNRMRHKIEIDESQRQLILLALARMSDERPGWTTAVEITAMCFPQGYELFTQFRNMEVEETMKAIGEIGKAKNEMPF